MKKTLFSLPFKSENPVQNAGQVTKIHPAVRSLAKLFRRIGRGAMLVSFLMGLFAGNIAHAKLGFMILLPCGLLLIAISAYMIKQVKFYRFKLAGRDAELFAFIMGGCALIGLIQVLVEKFILHK